MARDPDGAGRAGGLLGGRAVDVHGGDARAGPCQHQRGGLPDAVPRSGNERDLIFQAKQGVRHCGSVATRPRGVNAKAP